MNSDSNQRRINNLEREDLNTLGKINEQIYSDPSVMFSSAEACTPLITYNELEQATNYWNKENILGKGGFGVVFKGIWKNTAVAIKRLESQVITFNYWCNSMYLLWWKVLRITGCIFSERSRTTI